MTGKRTLFTLDPEPEHICIICRQGFDGKTYDPWPVARSSRCCELCHIRYVQTSPWFRRLRKKPMQMKEIKDVPFNECHRQALDYINKGWDIWQKFTCNHCGARQTMEKPNLFYIAGKCEECGRISSINDCGFMAAKIMTS